VELRREAVFLWWERDFYDHYTHFSQCLVTGALFCVLKCPKMTKNSCYVFKVSTPPLVGVHMSRRVRPLLGTINV
jgi:hypothetical protein